MKRLVLLLYAMTCTLVYGQEMLEKPVFAHTKTLSMNALQFAVGQFQLNYEQRKENRQVAFTAQIFGSRYNQLYVNEMLVSRDSLFSVNSLGFALGVRIYESKKGNGLFTQIVAGYKDMTMDYSRVVVTENWFFLPTQADYVRHTERRTGPLLEIMGGYRVELHQLVIEPNGGFVIRRMRSQQDLPYALPPQRMWLFTQASFFTPFLGVNLGCRF